MTTFTLSCDNFNENLKAGLLRMLESNDFANVTIAVEGKYLKAHQMVLSICSPYFNALLQANPCKHPIFFMKGVKYHIMVHLLRFMYEGQTQIPVGDLPAFIETANELQVEWLNVHGSNTAQHQDLEKEHDKDKRERIQFPVIKSEPDIDIVDEPVNFHHDGETETPTAGMVDSLPRQRLIYELPPSAKKRKRGGSRKKEAIVNETLTSFSLEGNSSLPVIVEIIGNNDETGEATVTERPEKEANRFFDEPIDIQSEVCSDFHRECREYHDDDYPDNISVLVAQEPTDVANTPIPLDIGTTTMDNKELKLNYTDLGDDDLLDELTNATGTPQLVKRKRGRPRNSIKKKRSSAVRN